MYCFADPCAVEKCERYPFAECRAVCCNAKFYLHGREVNCGKFFMLELIYSLINFRKWFFRRFSKKNF